jgi:hypothetical protein
MVLEYANHRVIALGERLDGVLDRINEGTLGHLAAMNGRYSNLNRNQPFVAEIQIHKRADAKLLSYSFDANYSTRFFRTAKKKK